MESKGGGENAIDTSLSTIVKNASVPAYLGIIALSGYSVYSIVSGDLLIWGEKDKALLDAWSLEHFFSGISLSYLLYNFSGPYSQAMESSDKIALGQITEEINISENDKKKIEKIFKQKTKDNKSIHHSLVVFVTALSWEVFEHYLELGLAGEAVQTWFAGVEALPNRLGTDILMVYLGWRLVRNHPEVSNSLAPLSTLWLSLHILPFGEKGSMYLHHVDSFGEIFDDLMSFKGLAAIVITIVVSFAVNKLKKNKTKNKLQD